MAVRVGFGVLIAGIILWAIFVFPLAIQLMQYRSYANQVAPDALSWTTIAVHDELWRPVAQFEYTVDGKKYTGKEIFQGGLYRTPYAAEMAIKEVNPVVWYASPSQATIEKFFPLKKLIYAFITLGLVVYSAYAAYYLTERIRWKG